MNDIKATRHEGDKFEIHDEHKWTAQEVGVNSNVPLVDAGTGRANILRQFEFSFNPEVLQKIRQNKLPKPSKQDLFNAHSRQIELMLWGDGLIPKKEVEPRILVGKKKYKIFVLCEARMGVILAEKPQTLQQITPNTKSA